MSLLSALISSPNTATIATDTDAGREDGRFSTSKLLPIPHLCAVLASRGQLAVLQFVFIRICGAGCFSRFDDLLDSMDDLLADIAQTMPPELVVALPGTRNTDLLALVGYSERQGRMVGTQWIRESGPYQRSEFTTLVAPWHPSLPQVPMTAENIERIARLQVGYMESEHPGGAFGGKLITANLTRSSVTVSHRLTFTQEAVA